jgi:ubiquinone/menaquinone biosynthesis C-methylase UbiE
MTDPVALFAEGRVSAPVALARMVLSGLSLEEIAARVAASPPLARIFAKRRAALADLARMVSTVGIDHDWHGATPADAVARIAALFDRAVVEAPEASVAAYSLGSADLLDDATRELVAWLDAEGLLAPDRTVLDLGCGIGRVAAAVAPRVRAITALDVSPAMIEAAQARHGTLPNVRFAVTSGLALDEIADASCDLVLAIDSFPYVQQAGTAVAERHVAEAARVLRPGGALAVANWSYRGDPTQDADEARRWAASHGFVAVHVGARPFALWDGSVFLLRRDDPWRAAMRRGDFAAAHAVADAVLAARDHASRDDPRLPYHLRWVWDGRALDGADVLVRSYHGLGDAIQFARFLRPLRERAASVTLEAPPSLVPLLQAADLGCDIVPFDERRPLPPRAGVVEIELMELAHALRATPDAPPVPIPYLRAPDRPARAHGVGLCWRAGDWDPARSVPREALFAALGDVPAIAIPRPDGGLHADVLPTARLIAGLSLVVTVDTMVAHLAGALGIRTFLLLRAECDWRWMSGRTDSPWYPSMRLYRQETEGDWSAPLARLGEDVRRLA